jgi:hypothetical protein
MIVRRMNRSEEEFTQCQLPKDKLTFVPWKGYRERRSDRNGKSAATCMRLAQWEVDGQCLCTQHAGIIALRHLSGEI